jgi:serine/threonine-protein kinase
MTQQEINKTSMLKVGTILHGTYRIDSYLSSGGFGNTYVATNVEFEEKVAIKEFFMKGVTQRDDNQTTVSVSNAENSNSFLEQKEKFKKEARRLRKLKNEHIVKVHDLFEENATAYYVMDYIDGENLAERLKRTGRPMTESEVRLILPQILDALKSVHDAGIWHLDLKPANIMLEKGGNVKLIDFGASKQLNAQKGGATTSTAISYTNGYAPREQMEQNYDKFGPWTDIYALGATLYNLLTNKRPPLPTDIDDDISENKHEALPFPESVGGLRFLVLQMMKTNRLQRPQNIAAIMEAEKLRKEESKQTPKQQPTSEHTSDFDDEETIIAQPQPKKEEKKPEPKPEPKVYSQPTQSSYTHVSRDNNSEGSGKGIVIAMIVALLFVIILLVNYKGCGNAVKYVEAVDSIELDDTAIADTVAFTPKAEDNIVEVSHKSKGGWRHSGTVITNYTESAGLSVCKTKIDKNNACKNGCIVAGGKGAVIIGKNSYASEGIPDYITNVLDEYKKSGNRINEIAITPNNKYVIVVEENGYSCNTELPELDKELNRANNARETIQSVSMSDNGNWAVITDQHYASVGYFDEIETARKKYGEVYSVSMTNKAVVICCRNGVYYKNVPQKLADDLCQLYWIPKYIKFTDGATYLITDGKSKFYYYM